MQFSVYTEIQRDRHKPLTEVAITVNPGGVEHWKSIKAQELFAREVIPRFRRHR